MWFLIFLFLVLSSLGNEFIFAKLLSIKEVGFPFTRYWFRFGSGYTFVSLIICCIGLNYFISKTIEVEQFKLFDDFISTHFPDFIRAIIRNF